MESTSKGGGLSPLSVLGFGLREGWNGRSIQGCALVVKVGRPVAFGDSGMEGIHQGGDARGRSVGF